MKTTFDIENILFAFITASPLATDISGGIYKRQRPAQSQSEDIVINCLPINNKQLQQAVANVNIHVPNLQVTVNGISDKSHADFARLQELADLAKVTMSDHWELQDYGFSIQQQQTIQDDISDTHYINFRLDILSINV